MTALIVAVATVASAFFSGLETGLVSANQFALYAAREKKVLYARAADFLLLKPDRMLSTTLIGTNISVVTATVILNRYLREVGPEWLALAGSAGLAVVMLIVAEILPKSFFRQNADTIAVRLAPVLFVFYWLFFPLAFSLNSIVKAILFVSGQLKPSKSEIDSRHGLRTLVRLGSREAGMPLEDLRIVEDIFDFQETIAREVMVHVHRTIACPTTMPIDEIVDMALASDVRFVPMYRHRLDNLVGYLDIEELVSAPEIDLELLIREPVFYPDTKSIPDLFIEMSAKKLSVVFLSNEYGRISGVITPDEIVAEIVGSKPGSRDSGYEEIQQRPDDSFMVAGVADVEDFRHQTRILIPSGPYDTVGGFMLAQLGRIPDVGERLTTSDAVFEVVDADDVHIKRIVVRRIARN